MWKEIVKDYFSELGNELYELGSNIWNNIKSIKCIIILSSILLFTIGCFIWKPLLPITVIMFLMLIISICIMIVPITCTALVFMLFLLDCLNEYTNYPINYPILRLTLGFICSILTLCLTSYFVWDVALRDMWINPEMWNELISINI